MTNIYFSMYQFHIRQKYSKKIEENYLNFNKIFKNEDLTLMDIFHKIYVENRFIHDKLRVTNQLDFNDENNSVSGLLNLGEYGNLRKIFNRNDEEWEDEIDENKIVCEPFFFRFYIPKESNLGFLVLEKKKSKPFTSVFFDSLKLFIKENFDGSLVFDFVPVIPCEVEPLFDNSDVVEFIYIKNEENKENFGDNQVTVSRKKITYDVRKNNLKLKQIREKKFLNNIRQKNSNHTIFANIKQNNKISIVNLDDIFENKMVYLDITEELDWEDGNPQYECIKNLAEHYTSTNFNNNGSIFDND